MQSTNTATTMAKMKWEGPKARPPTRISTVWTAIMAKPSSRAAAAKMAKPSSRVGPVSGAGAAATSRPRMPSAAKIAPASRFTTPMPSSVAGMPKVGIRKKAAARAPTKAPAALNPYTSAWKRVASSRLRARAWVRSGIVPPISTVGGPIRRAVRPTSATNAAGSCWKGRRTETARAPRKSRWKARAQSPMAASTAP